MEPERADYAAWIGLDWGSCKHAICLQAADSSLVERCILEQKPEALHSWFRNLLARFGGRKVAVAIEQSRGAVIHFLLALDFVHVFRIHEFAGQSILQCDWARAYYDHKKAEGKGHHACIRALAYRWIRIIYRCWKDRVPYNEQKYMESLRQKRPNWLASSADSELITE